VHNIYLQTLLDVGVIGSIAYWGVMVFLIVRTCRLRHALSPLGRSVAIGSVVSLLAVGLFGVFDAVPLGSKIGILQWISGGLILAAWRTSSVDNRQPVRLC
jgi:hypothetical protein